MVYEPPLDKGLVIVLVLMVEGSYLAGTRSLTGSNFLKTSVLEPTQSCLLCAKGSMSFARPFDGISLRHYGLAGFLRVLGFIDCLSCFRWHVVFIVLSQHLIRVENAVVANLSLSDATFSFFK